ncbi:MAG TPA: hypothetical protein VGP72_15370 [Planctomycetota bacterium]
MGTSPGEIADGKVDGMSVQKVTSAVRNNREAAQQKEYAKQERLSDTERSRKKNRETQKNAVQMQHERIRTADRKSRA